MLLQLLMSLPAKDAVLASLALGRHVFTVPRGSLPFPNHLCRLSSLAAHQMLPHRHQAHSRQPSFTSAAGGSPPGGSPRPSGMHAVVGGRPANRNSVGSMVSGRSSEPGDGAHPNSNGGKVVIVALGFPPTGLGAPVSAAPGNGAVAAGKPSTAEARAAQQARQALLSPDVQLQLHTQGRSHRLSLDQPLPALPEGDTESQPMSTADEITSSSPSCTQQPDV